MLRLSDIVSHAGLHRFAEVALVLFVLAFIAIVLHLFAPSRKRELDAMAAKPLEHDRDDSPGRGANS